MFTSALDRRGKGCEFRGRADTNAGVTSPSGKSQLQQDKAIPHHELTVLWQTLLPGWADEDHAAKSHSTTPEPRPGPLPSPLRRPLAANTNSVPQWPMSPILQA